MLEFLLVSHIITDVSQDSSPPGKNQSACWMMGSMMPTICRDKVVIISVMFLETKRNKTETAAGSSCDECITCIMLKYIRFCVGPKQVRAQNDRHVTRSHLVGVLVLA